MFSRPLVVARLEDRLWNLTLSVSDLLDRIDEISPKILSTSLTELNEEYEPVERRMCTDRRIIQGLTGCPTGARDRRTPSNEREPTSWLAAIRAPMTLPAKGPTEPVASAPTT